MPGAGMYKASCVVFGLALFLPLWALTQSGDSAATTALAAMRDKSRPLLIFYPGASQIDPYLQEQKALFRGHEAQLKERDVVLMFLPLVARDAAAHGDEAHLQSRFHIEDGRFTVVLLGKDGGEKFRSHEPVTIEKLNALIDAMPMRQQEMRDGHHAE